MKVFLLVLLVYLYSEVTSKFEYLILAQLVGSICAFVILTINTRESLMQAVKASFDFTLLKRVLVYTIPLIGSGLTFWGVGCNR